MVHYRVHKSPPPNQINPPPSHHFSLNLILMLRFHLSVALWNGLSPSDCLTTISPICCSCPAHLMVTLRFSQRELVVTSCSWRRMPTFLRNILIPCPEMKCELSSQLSWRWTDHVPPKCPHRPINQFFLCSFLRPTVKERIQEKILFSPGMYAYLIIINRLLHRSYM
jgi:hypothetical protein